MINSSHSQHKTYFPFILVGLSILLFVTLAAWYRPADSELITTTTVNRSSPTHEEYIAAVSPVMLDFISGTITAPATYDRLIDITVPTSDQGTHLELVIIMGKFRDGQTELAEARYTILKQSLSWLP